MAHLINVRLIVKPNQKMTLEIRNAVSEDAESISNLIHDVAHYFTLEPDGQGADHFLETITPTAIKSYIINPDFNYLVAISNSKIIGVGATKGGTHLYHLFVAEELHGNGVGYQLWLRLYSSMKQGCKLTLFSTVFAVPAYEKFGFTATGSKVEKDGIAFVPMELVPKA